MKPYLQMPLCQYYDEGPDYNDCDQEARWELYDEKNEYKGSYCERHARLLLHLLCTNPVKVVTL